MIIRVGLPETTGILPQTAEDADLPALVSAAALWHGDRFRIPGERLVPLCGDRRGRAPSRLDGLDVALDSAGFTAMVHPAWGGRYPWTIRDYVALALSRRWAWWSAMDYCVEPQIAGDRATVEARVVATADSLSATLAEVDPIRIGLWISDVADGGDGLTAAQLTPDPMPILQGWRPEDYLRSVALIGEVLAQHGRAWPSLVGVGSVCRRDLRGPFGLWAVLEVLDRVLPAHVGLHLFGVKSDAINELAGWPRVVSVDSQAWDRGLRGDLQSARRQAVDGGATMAEANAMIRSSDRARADRMVRWHGEQVGRLASGARPGQIPLLWRPPSSPGAGR